MCWAGGVIVFAYQLELGDEVGDGARRGANQAMFAADEAQQHGELEVAQVVDLF